MAGRIYALVWRVYEDGIPQRAEVGRLAGPIESDGVSMPIDEYLRLRISDHCTSLMRARFPALGRFAARGVPARSMADWDQWRRKPRRLAPGEPLPSRKLPLVELRAFKAKTDADILGPPPAQDMFLFSKAAPALPDAGPLDAPTVSAAPATNYRGHWAAALAMLVAISFGLLGWFIARRWPLR